jgi:hypothetical protein
MGCRLRSSRIVRGMVARRIALGVYFAVCAAALVYPGYAWLGGRVEPYLLGLPFSFAYSIGWVVLSFLVLLAFHLAEERSS